jgi:hypothetical protein
MFYLAAMKPRACLLLSLAFAIACSDDNNGPAPGFTRYTTPTITLQPGESGVWVQWVAPALDHDVDIVDVTGWQGPAGHHAILISTSDVEPVGTVRPWKNTDQLSLRLLGGTGGEATDLFKLPPGVVFRVPKGNALAVQTHYINATTHVVTTSSYVDAKYAPPDSTAKLANLFVLTSDRINVVPGESSIDIGCTLPHDVNLLMYTNHMHSYGHAVTTTQVAADGTETVLKDDPSWDPEWALNPNFARRDLGNLLTLPAGANIKISCHWTSDANAPIMFPDEMCVFLGIAISNQDLTCVDGRWIE